MTVTTSGSCLWCQKVVCLVMLKNDLVHKWVFTSLPQIDSTVIYGSNSIVYQSISIPLLRGGGVPNGRGGREHKALKIKTLLYCAYRYHLPLRVLLPGGGELSYSCFVSAVVSLFSFLRDCFPPITGKPEGVWLRKRMKNYHSCTNLFFSDCIVSFLDLVRRFFD